MDGGDYLVRPKGHRTNSLTRHVFFFVFQAPAPFFLQLCTAGFQWVDDGKVGSDILNVMFFFFFFAFSFVMLCCFALLCYPTVPFVVCLCSQSPCCLTYYSAMLEKNCTTSADSESIVLFTHAYRNRDSLSRRHVREPKLSHRDAVRYEHTFPCPHLPLVTSPRSPPRSSHPPLHTNLDLSSRLLAARSTLGP